MPKDDASQELLAATMKELFPPRVELQRPHYARLQKLSQQTGWSLEALVAQAIEDYLLEKGESGS